MRRYGDQATTGRAMLREPVRCPLNHFTMEEEIHARRRPALALHSELSRPEATKIFMDYYPSRDAQTLRSLKRKRGAQAPLLRLPPLRAQQLRPPILS